MNAAPWPRQVALLLLAAVLGGCSSFEHDWRAATRARVPLRAFAPSQADPFGGAWDGAWTSAEHRTSSGEPHGGRLRCLFTRLDEHHYRARFKANWLIFSSGYATTFAAARHGNQLQFHGEHDLGSIFGGIYRYEGRATAEQFTASYASSYDRGRFEMRRPAP
ncbi:MAG: hypothetical protein QOE70_2609 [Chthoniobacter sp.]|nr:hypothetical protein [Chthoniobacter sp.]